jgi:putative selenate reductase
MSTDKFYPVSLSLLLQMIFKEYKRSQTIFGIPESLFFKPHRRDPFRTKRFGQLLETPLGVAAGPHTQLSQNIIAAWLTGARFIELKTVQTLDELEISKPCIDMYDEGYNCEWSQELKIKESIDQYVDAWVAIHVLKDFLKIGLQKKAGFIFNMSVGYNFDGIMNENVQLFFKKMKNANDLIEKRIKEIQTIYPKAAKLKIETRISDSITLSTMHGCPPDEIEKIGMYLINHKKLNTTIKLNPTLLGREKVWQILKQNGFPTTVPEAAFEHDVKYEDAVQIIRNLQEAARKKKVHFGVKLTNTLESLNNRDVFPANEAMMYMSGRALHPISVNVAAKLQHEFGGTLDTSFSAGATADNIADLIACGLHPVTVCTDLLKPGGYTRLKQYIDSLNHNLESKRAKDLSEYIKYVSSHKNIDTAKAIQINLDKYAQRVQFLNSYKRQEFRDPSIKTKRPLGYFDCIHAPCEDTCPTNQDIPTYNHFSGLGDFENAGNIILQTNPFPQTTGMICDHLCQTKCTRINYDHAVHIREIKRFVAEHSIAKRQMNTLKNTIQDKPKKVAIIGAGPSGLSCAWFLARAGFKVTIYESKPEAGGMISGVIPAFRLTNGAIATDIEHIKALGVQIRYNSPVDRQMFDKLKSENEYVYIAAGAQKSARLNIEGVDVHGVLDPLELLDRVKKGDTSSPGKQVVIIGGGNTAMDVARTAHRLVGEQGKVTVVYRRTMKEMPADLGEIKAVLEEGVEILELTAPEKVISKNGTLTALRCSRMELGERDKSGRRSPVRIPNSEFDINIDALIPAIGQELAFDFGFNDILTTSAGTYETEFPGVFMGGDALRGASTAINAIGDGRKIAQTIIDREDIDFKTRPENTREPKSLVWHAEKRACKEQPVLVPELSMDQRRSFKLVSTTLSEADVKKEAQRCMLCDEYCSICTTVCPNLANVTYAVDPGKYMIQEATLLSDGKTNIKTTGVFEITQPYQILNIANFCNECGNCSTFCPSNGAPYKDKPKIFLTRPDFESCSDGFWFEEKDGVKTLYRKALKCLSTLTELPDEFVFENCSITAKLDKRSMTLKSIDIGDTTPTSFSTREILEMRVIMNGAVDLIFV